MPKKLILFIMIFLLCLSSVYAISIGISPGRLRYQEVLRSGYAERSLRITTSSDEVVKGHFVVTGEIKDWLSFRPNTTTFSMSKGNPYELTVIVQPPSDVRTSNYTGHIEFITDTIGSVSGRAGGIIKTAVILIVNSEVTGIEIIDCRVGAFSFKDIEIDFPLEFSLDLINDGNVRLKPTITVGIWDQLQENVLLTDELIGDEVLPTTKKKMFRQISHNLGIGQYWVDVKVDECNAQDFLTFSVVEKGGIIDKGYLREIIHKPWVLVGETVEIIAKFANTGQRAVNAKFKGAIRLDDQIVKIIETEEIIVPSSETGDFTFFFTPEKPGRYMLNGRVVYNKKLTFEKGSVINVNITPPVEKKDEISFLIPLIIYIAIIITIIFMIRKILKGKREKRIF